MSVARAIAAKGLVNPHSGIWGQTTVRFLSPHQANKKTWDRKRSQMLWFPLKKRHVKHMLLYPFTPEEENENPQKHVTCFGSPSQTEWKRYPHKYEHTNTPDFGFPKRPWTSKGGGFVVPPKGRGPVRGGHPIGGGGGAGRHQGSESKTFLSKKGWSGNAWDVAGDAGGVADDAGDAGGNGEVQSIQPFC